MQICTKCDSPRLIVGADLKQMDGKTILSSDDHINTEYSAPVLKAKVCLDCSHVEFYAVSTELLIE